MLNSRIRPVLFRLVLGAFLALIPVAVAAVEPPAGKRLKKGSAKTQKVRAKPSKGKRAQRAEPTEGKRAERTKPTKGKRAERQLPTAGNRDHRGPRAEGKRVRKARPQKDYVKTRRDFRHIRVARAMRRDDGRLDVRRALARSTRIMPIVLNRFEDRRRNQIQHIIRHFHDGRRRAALELWGTFIDSLVDIDVTIDLDDVMLYVVREGCQRSDATFAFRAARLEFLRESQYRLDDYIEELLGRRDACRKMPYACGPDTLRDMGSELNRTRGELELIELRVREAADAFDSAVRLSNDYEARFGSTYEDMYHEIELRIRISP